MYTHIFIYIHCIVLIMNASLEDSLLDDLNDLSDGDEVIEEQKVEVGDDGKELVLCDDDRVKALVNQNELSSYHLSDKNNGANINSSSFLGGGSNILENKNLAALLDKIRRSGNTNGNTTCTMGDAQSIYETILACNRYLANISNALVEAHSVLCLAYKMKFPELEDLVLDPVKYKECVKILQNETDVTLKNRQLNHILNSNQVLTISVAGSTTSGRILSVAELKQVNDCIKYIDDVFDVQKELIKFVEEHMVRIAPNVSAIVGAGIAARVVGLAGGLVELSRIPACNIQVLGQVKQTAQSRSGMASTSGKPHMGIIAECDLVANTPLYLQKKVLKQVAAKISLAARCDSVHTDKLHGRGGANASKNNGHDAAAAGRLFREEIVLKITKFQEPEKAQTMKVLPKPNLASKKRRGGKKVRRMKERFETTELQKQANKRSFNVGIGEYGDDAMGMTLGMLDSKDGGTLRQAVEKKKMRQGNTKATRKKAAQMARSSGASSGLVSSMVFTPVQGLELVNPDAFRDKVKDANNKWFSEGLGFQSALPKNDT